MKQRHKLTSRAAGLGILLATIFGSQIHAGDVHFDVLHFGTETLTNATVTGKSKTDVYVMHSQGLINVKIRDLDTATLYKLGLGPKPDGYQDEKLQTSAVMTVAAKTPAVTAGSSQTFNSAPAVQWRQFPSLKISTRLMLGVAVASVAVFLFFSYCLKLVVQKSGAEPGVLVWIPVLQLVPMLQAAQMSRWWILGFCIPGINLVAHVLWAIKIVKVREKSVWVTIALLLPVINLAGFIYLAFSSVEKEVDDEGYMRGVLTPLPQQT